MKVFDYVIEFLVQHSKVRHIEYIFLAKDIKKVYLLYFRYKITHESIKMSDHG